ncbi:hypothetical protein VP01_871g2 [Puccinia sorghi]|uniref:Uncharacterized protein n=1 Tax=Puccinia sorghi TaxID=27349 RepID=A0A0L6U8R9_9BASI|nr:hypothetical protein VP01_871g2 [Puccinia sorghi]
MSEQHQRFQSILQHESAALALRGTRSGTRSFGARGVRSRPRDALECLTFPSPPLEEQTMSFAGYRFDSPARVQRRIQQAEEYEEALDSLPGLPPEPTSYPDSFENRRPCDLYDVGISENTTINTTFVPRIQHSHHPPIVNHQPNPRTTPRPPTSNHQPTNMDQPQIIVDSPFTSTPATAHPSRQPKDWFRNHSPNSSHIPQNQDSGQDVARITSSSEPETETDQPQPDSHDEDSSIHSDSDEDRGDFSKKSLGDLNLQSPENHQPRNNQYTHLQKASSLLAQAQPHSCPSPSSSHSTIQAHPSRAHSREQNPHEPSGSQLTSPGVGRRDSSYVDNSLTLDDIQESFSREMGHEFERSKKSSFERSPAFQPEPVPNPDSFHHQKSILDPSGNLSRMRNILRTNSKPIQSRMPFRSARRPFTPRRLTEVADDTTELSRLPDNQSHHVNHSQPVHVAPSESEATSHDLTTFPATRHRDGRSLVSLAHRSQRFDGNKLNSFLHNLNGQLSKWKINLCVKGSYLLSKIQTGMIDVHDSIAELQSNFNPTHGVVNAASQPDSAATSNLLFERQIRRLENQLEERDEEIEEIRNQLLHKFPPASSSLKQNFELKDRLAHVQAELASKEDEVDQLKLQHIDLAGENATTVSEWRIKYEKLLADHNEALAKQAAFDHKITTLKDQATALIQEKDQTIQSMNSRYKEVRRLTSGQAKVLEEPKLNQSTGQPSLEVLETVKTELEQVLNGKGDQSVGRSAERRIRMLHSWLQSEISNNGQKTNQDDSEPAKQHDGDTRQSSHMDEELRAKIEELGLELTEKDFKIEALSVSLRDSEDARTTLEREYTTLETQVDILEAKTIAQQSTITGLQAKLTQALKSTFSDVSFTPSRATPKGHTANNHSELAKAREEINRLKDLLNQSENVVTCEIQNMKIQALETHRPTALISTPSRSSCHFQSIISMRTPKTPGKMLGNMTSILAGDSGDETIVPMLNQINDLQQQVEQLRHQLDLANKNFDRKLAQLAEASEDAMKVSTEAITARKRADDMEEKARQLEERLDKLIAEDGTIAQVKHRLSNIPCPDCGERFDANQIVRFRVLPETKELEFTE